METKRTRQASGLGLPLHHRGETGGAESGRWEIRPDAQLKILPTPNTRTFKDPLLQKDVFTGEARFSQRYSKISACFEGFTQKGTTEDQVV